MVEEAVFWATQRGKAEATAKPYRTCLACSDQDPWLLGKGVSHPGQPERPQWMRGTGQDVWSAGEAAA